MSKFFYKNWVLYYLLLFFMIGWLVYALLWIPKGEQSTVYVEDNQQIERLKQELEDCNNKEEPEQEQPLPENTVQCNNEVNSGEQGTTSTNHELGNKSGVVQIDYNMNRVPDKLEVFYDGNLVASTNQLVSGVGRLSFNYQVANGKPTHCTVVVSAPQDDTVWEYLLNCPR